MRYNFHFIFYLFILLCFSCKDKFIIKQETEIINDIFIQITSDKLFFPLNPPPPPFVESVVKYRNGKVDSSNTVYNKRYKEYNEKLNANRYVISIEDSTYLIKDKLNIIDNLKFNGYTYLAFQITNSDEKSRLPLDLIKIKNIGKFEIISRKILFPKGINFIKYNGFDLTYFYFGNVTLSRPFLNGSSDFGCVIYTLKCGFECDQSFILIIKKQNHKWNIIDKINFH